MLSQLTDPEAVERAIAEFDDLGRDGFLAKYGFGKGRTFFLVRSGKRYDAKAIVGAAYGFQHGQPLAHASFNGGERTVASRLRQLGFSVSVEPAADLYASLTREMVESAVADFLATGRERYLKKVGVVGAARYFIEQGENRVDAKPVLLAAMRSIPGNENLATGDIAGNAKGVAEPLRKLGFTVIDQLRAFADACEEILGLQRSYAAKNSPEMQKRGTLLGGPVREGLASMSQEAFGSTLRDEITDPKNLSSYDADRARLAAQWDVGSGNGVGSFSRVPWARVFDERFSPKTNSGYYVVALFSERGSRMYLSLNHGSTKWSDTGTSMEAIDQEEAARLVEHARLTLMRDGLLSKLERHPRWVNVMDLESEEGSLGAAYESTNVVALKYERGELPDDDQFAEDLGKLLDLLHTLYAGEPPHMKPASHILLRWSHAGPKGAETVERHREVLASRGSVVWAKFGSPIADSRVGIFIDQIAKNVPTYAYLVGGDPRKLFRARLKTVSQGLASVDRDLIPEYYRDELDGGETMYTFSDIEHTDLYPQLDDLLVLESKPDQPISQSLTGQNTVFFVKHKDEGVVMNPLADLCRKLHWSQEKAKELVDCVDGPKTRQMILTGPPGTGKTFVAQALADHLTDGDKARQRFIQFHPTYGYEEFVEGLRPVTGSGGIAFEQAKGVLLQVVDSIIAHRSEGKPATHVLIIDEINRANLHRVFGELMFLLEYRDQKISLMLQQGFELPTELVIVGTMNTADRSIKTLDVAMRRRFNFLELLPDPEVLSSHYSSNPNRQVVDRLLKGFVDLNEQLTKDLDRHHTIGHSYFMTSEPSVGYLQNQWKRQLHPLIEDYFFDQPDKAAEYTFDKFW